MSETNTVSPLRQHMIEDMAARKLNPHTQRSHIHSCKRFAAWLKRSPDTATPDEVRRFQLYLIESGTSICNRNRIMTGVRFLFRVTLRRHDLAAEVWHVKEPQRLPPVLSPGEVKRVLTMATSLKARAMLTLAYGCGPRASEVVRLRAGDIDSEQKIIRIVQSKGRKDRHVTLPAEVLKLLRQWWKARPTTYDDGGVTPEQCWLFPGRMPQLPVLIQVFVGNSEADRNGSATCDLSPAFDWFLKAAGVLALGQQLAELRRRQRCPDYLQRQSADA
jgi:integrase/recombinase XerD